MKSEKECVSVLPRGLHSSSGPPKPSFTAGQQACDHLYAGVARKKIKTGTNLLMMPVEMHVYASMAKIISMLISIQMLPYIAAKLAQELK